MSKQIESSKAIKEDSSSAHNNSSGLPRSEEGLSEEYSSELSDSEESIKIILEESEAKNSFLMRTGLVFIIYLIFLLIVAVFVRLDVVRARFWFRAMRASVIGWVALGLSIAIKLLMGFLGDKLRLLMSGFFFLDCIFSMVAFLGIYFVSEDYTRGEYRHNFHEYMVIGVFIMFLSMIGFIIATLIKSKNRFSFIAGFLFMEFMMIGGLIISIFFWRTGNITRSRYIFMAFIFTIVNFYFALNAYLVLQYRTKKFFDDDSVWNFFCFFTDLISNFWYDLVMNNKSVKKQLKKRKRKAKKARKKAREEAKKEKETRKKSKKPSVDSEEYSNGGEFDEDNNLERQLNSDNEDIERGVRA